MQRLPHRGEILLRLIFGDLCFPILRGVEDVKDRDLLFFKGIDGDVAMAFAAASDDGVAKVVASADRPSQCVGFGQSKNRFHKKTDVAVSMENPSVFSVPRPDIGKFALRLRRKDDFHWPFFRIQSDRVAAR